MDIEKRVAQLEQLLMPLLDRAQRMMIRALDRLDAKRCGKQSAIVAIAQAIQVNLSSTVRIDIG